jgi:proteic killer suppression protein
LYRTSLHYAVTGPRVIRSFRRKGLETLFTTSSAKRVPAAWRSRIERILDRLDAAVRPQDMSVPGWRLHSLRGDQKDRWAVEVSGNLRLTFAFDGEHAIDVDLEDYH